MVFGGHRGPWRRADPCGNRHDDRWNSRDTGADLLALSRLRRLARWYQTAHSSAVAEHGWELRTAPSILGLSRIAVCRPQLPDNPMFEADAHERLVGTPTERLAGDASSGRAAVSARRSVGRGRHRPDSSRSRRIGERGSDRCGTRVVRFGTTFAAAKLSRDMPDTIGSRPGASGYLDPTSSPPPWTRCGLA